MGERDRGGASPLIEAGGGGVLVIDAIVRGFSTALADIIRWVPLLIGFVAILIVGWIVARVLEGITDRLLESVGFDKLVQRGGVSRVMEQTRYDVSSLIGRVVFYIVMLFTLQLAFGLFPTNPVTTLLTAVIAFLPRLIVAALIVVIGAAVASVVRDVVKAAISPPYDDAISIATSVGIMIIAVFAALDELQIAPAIVQGLFFAILAIIVGSAVIAIGGGGIQPMRQYWDRFLRAAEEQMPAMQEPGAAEKAKMAAKEKAGEAERMREKPEEKPPPGKVA